MLFSSSQQALQLQHQLSRQQLRHHRQQLLVAITIGTRTDAMRHQIALISTLPSNVYQIVDLLLGQLQSLQPLKHQLIVPVREAVMLLVLLVRLEQMRAAATDAAEANQPIVFAFKIVK